jgi:hypothetical protein
MQRPPFGAAFLFSVIPGRAERESGIHNPCVGWLRLTQSAFMQTGRMDSGSPLRSVRNDSYPNFDSTGNVSSIQMLTWVTEPVRNAMPVTIISTPIARSTLTS